MSVMCLHAVVAGGACLRVLPALGEDAIDGGDDGDDEQKPADERWVLHADEVGHADEGGDDRGAVGADVTLLVPGTARFGQWLAAHVLTHFLQFFT